MFSLKVIWFAFSLSGILACWAALGSFVRAARSLWVPVAYCAANTVLQGVFCLGLIWKLDPSTMPHSFRLAQIVLIQTAWTCIAALTILLCFSTSATTTRCLRWATNIYTKPLLSGLFVLVLSCAEAISQSVVLLKVDVPQSPDGMVGDTSNPPWIRVLGYAGANLILVIPSLLVSLLTLFRLFSIHRQHDDIEFHFYPDDGLTRIPSRRSAMRTSFYRHHAPSPDTPFPNLMYSSQHTPTPSTTRTVLAITTRTDSPTFTVLTPPGRTKTMVSRSRYHLPSNWTHQVTADSPTHSARSPASESRSSPISLPRPSLSSERSTYTPMAFASPSEAGSPSPRTSHTLHDRQPSLLSITDESDEKYTSESADWILRGGEIRIPSDTVSGPLRWARSAAGTPNSLDTKSELEFASVYERIEVRSRPPHSRNRANDDLRNHTQVSSRLSTSTWRLVFFQIFICTMQVLAAMSSLIDAISRHPTSIPFGSQDVARLLVAWGPCMLFGIHFLPQCCRS